MGLNSKSTVQENSKGGAWLQGEAGPQRAKTKGSWSGAGSGQRGGTNTRYFQCLLEFEGWGWELRRDLHEEAGPGGSKVD